VNTASYVFALLQQNEITLWSRALVDHGDTRDSFCVAGALSARLENDFRGTDKDEGGAREIVEIGRER